MAYDGSLIFDTKIDGKGFKKGVEGLKSAASTSMKIVNGLMLAGAVAVAGIGIASIKAGSDFEAGMSNVAATMGITVDEIKKGDKSFKMLEKAALDMGKATQFSATQATEALNFLALAGYDAEKAVDTLPKVLNLAAAGGLELEHSAELVTKSMNALGLESDQLDSFVDQLAVTAQKSGTNVAQLGEAILTVGGTAKILKGGTVELNTQLGILADNGIMASEGGTALRNVLLALSAPTDKQAKALKELGAETYDANGNFRSTDDIFQDLNKTLGTMTEQKRTEVLSELFNKVDLKAANALLAGSGDRFAELSDKILKSEGAAAEMAATLNDNLKGKIELLKSAMEYLGIVIYKSVDSPLKDVVETFTGYIDKISGVLTAHDDARASMEELGYSARQIEEELKGIPDGFEGAAVIIGEILADMLINLAESAPKFLEMGVNLTNALLDGLRDNLPQITESAVELIQGFITAYLEILPEIYVLGIELITNLIQGIAEMLPELIPVGLDAVTTIIDALMVNLPLILEAGMQIIMMLAEGITQNIDQTIDVAMDIISKIADFLIQNLPLIIEAGVQLLVALIEGISNNTSELISTVIDIIIMLADTIIDNLPEIIKAGLELLVALVKGIMDNLPKLIAEVPRIINSFADAIYSNLPTILKSAIGIMLEIIKGLIESIPTLVKNLPQIIMAIVNAFTLYNWWNLGKGVIAKLKDGIVSMGKNLAGSAKGLATKGINAIKTVFSDAPKIGKGLVEHLITGVKILADSLVTTVKGMGTNAINAIKTAFSGAKGIGKNLVQGIWNGINNAKDWVLGKIRGFGDSIVNGIKDIFKIKSPSQVMRDEVGVMIGRGLADGIDKSQGEVKRSTEKMGKTVLDIAQSINKDLVKQTNKNSKDRLRLAGEDSKKLLSVSEKHLQEEKRLGNMSLKDEVDYWHEMSKYVGYGTEEYAKMLENRQKAVSEINNEIVKINEDYSKKILDIDKKLVDETRKLNEEYSKAYDDRVKDLVNVAGLFGEFVEKEQASGSQLISNLQSQVEALTDYGDTISDLDSRIGNADLMGELRDLGPKAIGELKSLNNMSDEELNEFVLLYEERFRLARTQADKELEPLKKDITNQIQELNRASQTELTTLQRAWNASIKGVVSGTSKELESLEQVGKSAIKGLEEGMLSMEDSLIGTTRRIADSIRDTLQSALDINSPSRVMRDEIGLNITRGISEGLKAGMGDLEKDINSEMSQLTRKMKSTVEFETSNNARVMTGSSGYSRGSEVITNNNDNGVVQNVTIVSPKNTPSENARQMRKVGRELSLGY